MCGFKRLCLALKGHVWLTANSVVVSKAVLHLYEAVWLACVACLPSCSLDCLPACFALRAARSVHALLIALLCYAFCLFFILSFLLTRWLACLYACVLLPNLCYVFVLHLRLQLFSFQNSDFVFSDFRFQISNFVICHFPMLCFVSKVFAVSGPRIIRK